MERRVTGAFAEYLEKDRDFYNARFSQVQRLNQTLSADEFMSHLSDTVAPLVKRAAEIDREKAEALCRRLYDVSLNLFSKGCLGSRTRHPVIGAAWKELLPLSAELLLKSPDNVVARVSNALYNLSMEKGADERQWLETMKQVAAWPGPLDSELLLEAGKAAAWRCGMAHYRDGALVACDNLPDEIFKVVFRIPADATKGEIEAVRALLKSDRWFDPSLRDDKKIKPLSVVRAVGGFAGFGGLFATPPGTTARDGDIYFYDDASHWVLYADAFGACMHRRGKGQPGPPALDCRPFAVRKDGFVEKGEAINIFPELANFESAAATPDTLAVCIPRSHFAFLIAQRRGFRYGLR